VARRLRHLRHLHSGAPAARLYSHQEQLGTGISIDYVIDYQLSVAPVYIVWIWAFELGMIIKNQRFEKGIWPKQVSIYNTYPWLTPLINNIHDLCLFYFVKNLLAIYVYMVTR